MDEYTSKRVANGYTSRRGSSAVLRDTANNRDQDGKYCSRIGCSGRLNSPKGARSSYSEKLKSPLQSFRTSSSGKEIAGSSSRTYYAVRGSKKSVAETQRKLSTQLETDSSETSSIQDEPETSHVVPSSNERIRTELRVGHKSSDSVVDTIMEPGSSSVAPKGRRDFNNQRSGMRSNKDTPASSSVLTGSKSSRPTSRGGADSNLSKRKDTAKKRNSEAESSSTTRGKKTNGSSSERRITSSGYGVSISDSRGPKNGSSNRENNVVPGRSRTSINGTSRARTHGNRPDRNSTLLHESRSIISQVSQGQSDSSIDNNAHDVSTELISDLPISYRRSDSINENMLNHRPASPAELGLARSLTTRDSFRHYGIAEVLLALERIEHEEELTYEQVILLETNLFLSGLNFYDQHRDMRLDIDNMSYEELLALEERMGTVSTAVTEEALSQCLNRSTYRSGHVEDSSAGGSEYEDGIKCCICQEEYSNGDEVGTLRCEHTYHEGCIQQWLRLKNWCPICKASVEEPASALPS
ncbi:E3 ubiquitin-protein ligase MBR2-like [Cucurbita pepo subsp. pepo]|uniref:E3 ubiquitin-protein ligase MBR2-like n=1 Tax=Cucurbita pepo subsp. pepo TaxID=3664 RepID=UPI000C9D6F48|nr:E3 ubiquitin-protein ligase MBR2-like [Cucurbita pepo subsp. pepo]